MVSFFVGLGPGGLKGVPALPKEVLKQRCLPGSNHGGIVNAQIYPKGDNKKFQVGDSYDKDNLTTFRGGSGGDAILSISSVFLFLFFSCLFPSLPCTGSKLAETSQIMIFVTTTCVIQTGQKHTQLPN